MEDNLIAKIIGVLSGAFLSLSYDPPRSRAGFLRRGASSILFGWVFGEPTLVFLDWKTDYNSTVAAFCLASMASWSAIGVLKKVVEAYKREG